MNAQAFLLTRNEAADLLRVHVRTIARWIDQEELPEVMIGGRSRIPFRSILEKMVDAGIYTKAEADSLERDALSKSLGGQK